MLTTMGHPRPRGGGKILSGDCRWRAKRRRQTVDKLTAGPARARHGPRRACPRSAKSRHNGWLQERPEPTALSIG